MLQVTISIIIISSSTFKNIIFFYEYQKLVTNECATRSYYKFGCFQYREGCCKLVRYWRYLRIVLYLKTENLYWDNILSLKLNLCTCIINLNCYGFVCEEIMRANFAKICTEHSTQLWQIFSAFKFVGLSVNM